MKKPKYIQAEFGVRYWEDTDVNGKEDTEGTLIPFRFNDIWKITIDADSGTILNWPNGVTVETHYKVCDECAYRITDEDFATIHQQEDGYVPDFLCPEGQGFGDYVIMHINKDGIINNWDSAWVDFCAENLQQSKRDNQKP